MLDPLNPHRIASTRRYAYTRFTLLTLVRCLLGFADAEFTRETGESVAKARVLYTTALELLDLPELKQQLDACDRKVGDLLLAIDSAAPVEVRGLARNVVAENLLKIRTPAALATATSPIGAVFANNADWPQRLARARSVVEEAVAAEAETVTVSSVLSRNATAVQNSRRVLLSQPSLDQPAKLAAQIAAADFTTAVSFVSKIERTALEKGPVALSWLRTNIAMSSAVNTNALLLGDVSAFWVSA